MISLAYYIRNIFASSYGKNKPKFFFWHAEGVPTSEKKLLFKIDCAILTYGCLAYFAKWLDQSNLSNAYVSGMKEDLNMVGTDYNLATTCFSVGQIIGPIPANLLLTWVPPRILLPGLELIWALLTIGTYAVKNVNQLYPLRFFIGFLEGSTFVGMQYVLGSWYKRTELGKRTAIFSCAAYVGSMIGGFLQSAVLAGLDGVNGLEAWRWVFIIDGCITIFVAVFGFVFFPDTPYNTKAFYLNEEEKARCIERLAEDGREETSNFTWDLFQRTLRSWQLYVLTLLWMLWSTTVGKVSNTVMQLWLKGDTQHHWSIYQVNNLPTAINGWNIVLMLLLTGYVDATGYRMRAVVFNLCILLFGTICLVIWEIPMGLRIVSYMFAGTDGPLAPIFYAWANIITAGDSQVRAMVLAIMNSCGAAMTTIIGQFCYPVTDAPTFSKGFKTSLAFVCVMSVWVFVVRFFEMREIAKRDAEVVVMEAADEDSLGDGIQTTPYDVKAETKA
ncbi:hypothetical protein VMCG_04488 [Cytospora schulzeri]|uniref:Major facilitator superfamily (MFS) profile domain-containing protein n=1 Tax=Cytospora schulzeri TaxID=448051 RepID=A0A423WRI3_9PEZI|nr:hypothetical protein VMCG_04488 [Valsa malicola]